MKTTTGWQRLGTLLMSILVGAATLAALAIPAGAQDGPPTPAPYQAGTNDAGYILVDRTGKVYPFGGAPVFGDTTSHSAAARDIESTPTGKGYWILTDDGEVHPFGDATDHGDATDAPIQPGEVVASMSAAPDGGGYWVFTTRGRVLAFGSAPFLGDVAALDLVRPVVGSVATRSGNGYLMVASDGGVFTFGDAAFAGALPAVLAQINGRPTLPDQPIVGLTPDPDGRGYWLVAADGGVFAFDAPFRGALPAIVPFGQLQKPINGMVPYGNGYLLTAGDGGVFNFSDLPFAGSLGGNPPSADVVGITTVPGTGAATGNAAQRVAAGLTAWPTAKPDSDTVLKENPPPPPPAGFRACQSVERIQVRTPEDLVNFDPTDPALWPGALIQGASYSSPTASRIEELPIRDRQPQRIRVNLLTGDNTDVVPDPTGASVGSRLGALINAAEVAGFEPGFDRIRFEQRENYSLKQTAFHLGIDARYLGNTVSAKLDTRGRIEENTVTAFFLEEAFTVTADLPDSAAELFGPGFSDQDLADLRGSGQLGPDNQPLFVQQVVYGRVLSYSVRSTASVDEIRRAISAHFETTSAEGDLRMTDRQREIIRSGSLEVYAVGGPRSAIGNVLSGGGLGSYFTEDAPLTSYKPVAYKLVQLDVRALGNPARVSQETTYTAESCEGLNTVGRNYFVETTNFVVHNGDCANEGLFEGDLEVSYRLALVDNQNTRLITPFPGLPPIRVATTQTLASRSASSPTVIRPNGATVTLSNNVRRSVPIRFGQNGSVQLSVSITEQDEFPNGDDDTMASISVPIYRQGDTWPQGPNGQATQTLSASVGSGKCSITLNYKIIAGDPIRE